MSPSPPLGFVAATTLAAASALTLADWLSTPEMAAACATACARLYLWSQQA
jgi:hypothetical protein